jgi:exonuclease III
MNVAGDNAIGSIRFPSISLLSQNVQSLNISSMCKKTSKKIFSVTREKDEIIFLSDIRLNSSKQVSATLDIGKRFGFRGYNFIHNSTTNSTGVGILISNKLNVSIHNTYKDIDCNILLLDISVGRNRITLGSVYGPNADNEEFFTDISQMCERFGNRNIILGGDWNTTYDGRSNKLNIDTINMADIPSRRRSKWLQNMCTRHGLSDPYRHFYPDRSEFTYIPNAVANLNRSRLDFFLINQDLLITAKNCTISHHLDSILFDHKSVRLSFRTNSNARKQVIRDTILKDPDLPSVVRCQVTEHYIHHALVCADFPFHLKDELLRTIGEINNKLDTVKGYLHDIATGNGNENTNDNLISTRQDIARLIELLPQVGYFESLALSCDDKSFFETLIMTIKNVTLSAQHFFFKIKNKTKDTLKKQLVEL